jgi:NAD(P)H-quinone oxidoreductase subunit 4
VDAEPREIYVISCLLVPIIGIGLYPRLMTDTYRASMERLVGQEDQAMGQLRRITGRPGGTPLAPFLAGGEPLQALQAPAVG